MRGRTQIGPDEARGWHAAHPAIVLLTLLLLLPPLAHATDGGGAAPYLVRDINATMIPEGSDPAFVGCTATYCLFTANWPTAHALWRTDGTSEGTWLLLENTAWPVTGFSALGPWFVFSRRDEAHGTELWRTDGTPAGTHLLKDIYAGPQSSNLSPRGRLGDTYIFSACDSEHGCELWKTDGSEEGTTLLADLTPGGGSTQTDAVVALGGIGYFFADQALWRTDGTEAGTFSVVESSGFGLVQVGNSLLFQKEPSPSTYELWRTDGTASGEALVKGGFTSALRFSSRVTHEFFLGSHGTEGSGLWVTDGTTLGTKFLCPAQEILWADGGTVFFSADDNDHGRELWRSDGEPGDCRLVADIRPGPESSYPYGPWMIGGNLFFAANDGSHGTEYWITDGTEIGTRMVADIAPGSISALGNASRTGLGTRLLFRAADDGTNYELWRSDGASEGTRLVRNIRPDCTSSQPFALAAIDQTLFFQARDGDSAYLYRSDGSESGTLPLAQLPFAYEGGATPPATVRPLYFTFVNCASALWRSDGTSQGTTQLLGSMPMDCNRTLAPGPSKAFFLASGALWSSDGSPSGTGVVRDVGLTSPFNSPETRPLWVDGKLLFEGHDGTAPGPQLWRSDGSQAGTFKVKVVTDDPNQHLVNFTKLGKRATFVSRGQYGGSDLWISDGTDNGTYLLASFPLHTLGNFASLSGVLYFTASGLGQSTSLWRSDGTPEGTTLVRDLGPSRESSRLTPADGNVFFLTTDPQLDTALWKSDGTDEGTVVVKSFGHVPYPDPTPRLANVNGIVYFRGFDPAHGFELWRSDGTPDGTTMVFDIAAGAASSSPGLFTLAGNTLFFRATTPETGTELWALDVSDTCTLALSHETLSGARLVRACYQILVGPEVAVTESANVVLRAGTQVVIRNGFNAASGAHLTIGTDPSLGGP